MCLFMCTLNNNPIVVQSAVSAVIFEVNSFLFLVNHVVQTVCFGQKYRESTSFEKAIKYQHQLFNKMGEGKSNCPPQAKIC